MLGGSMLDGKSGRLALPTLLFGTPRFIVSLTHRGVDDIHANGPTQLMICVMDLRQQPPKVLLRIKSRWRLIIN
jgi:hypothetical protein